MKQLGKSGAALAAAALSLAVIGSFTAPAYAVGDKICAGVNSCKGTSDCHTYNNSCKGQNACKGQGFKLLSSIDCTKMGGKVIDTGSSN